MTGVADKLMLDNALLVWSRLENFHSERLLSLCRKAGLYGAGQDSIANTNDLTALVYPNVQV